MVKAGEVWHTNNYVYKEDLGKNNPSTHNKYFVVPFSLKEGETKYLGIRITTKDAPNSFKVRVNIIGGNKQIVTFAVCDSFREFSLNDIDLKRGPYGTINDEDLFMVRKTFIEYYKTLKS